MVDLDKVVGAILSLFVAGVLRNTLLKEAIDNWYVVDTSTWHWATAALWQVIPILIIAIVVFVPLATLASAFD